MTPNASMDFETYSEAGYVWDGQKWRGLPNAPGGKKGLPIVGAAVYAKHPSTEVLCLRYDLKRGDGIRLWTPGDALPLDLFHHIEIGRLFEAWNSSFEAWIWSEVCVKRMRWIPLPIRQLRCTMGRARAYGLPGSLGKAGEVLQLSTQKGKEGARLINKFCIPRNPTLKDARRRILPEGDPEGPFLYEYCKTDVATESEASGHIPHLQGAELEYWLCDQAINRRGVQADMKGISDCCAILDQALEKYNTELATLTGGAVMKGSELAKLKTWLETQGLRVDTLDEEAIDMLLKAPGIGKKTLRSLQIRKAIGVAAVKKAYAMRNRATEEGRLHDLLIYHGARTGRCTGEGPQPTNMPNSGPEVSVCPSCKGRYAAHMAVCPTCWTPNETHPVEWDAEAAQFALEHVISTRSLEYVEYVFGDALSVVSGCLRGLFIAADGHRLMCSDYSSIEAVVLAELSGEEWRMEVFRTHGMIYETSAAKISGLTLPDFIEHKACYGKHHPLRKMGKVAELASGYQGWIGAWKAFGAESHFKDDEEMKQAILAWRDASPMIVDLWKGYENCAVSCIQDPTQAFSYRGITFFLNSDGAMQIRLLSGRLLTYHRPELRQGDRGVSISYEGWNSNPKNGPTGWQRMDTWGGKLTENIVQATAADILRFATINLEVAGYPLVLHVYDEVICEVPNGHGSVEEFESIMVKLPDWANGWPIRASGGWEGRRYRK